MYVNAEKVGHAAYPIDRPGADENETGAWTLGTVANLKSYRQKTSAKLLTMLKCQINSTLNSEAMVAVIGYLTVGRTKKQYTLCWVLDAHYHGYRMLQLTFLQAATIYLQHKRL